MHWLHSVEEPWRLTKFVPNDDRALEFEVIPATYAHDRSRKSSGLDNWRDFAGHGNTAWHRAHLSARPCGIVTAFPQLPVVVGLRKHLARSRIPLVAWTFNLGKVYPGLRRTLSRFALESVNRFIVHSRAEIDTYSEWLDLPANRFQFVRFETQTRAVEFEEEREKPFVVSIGSANRDYGLLFEVLAELKYPSVIVASAHAVDGLSVPSNVVVRSGIAWEECFKLMQQARVNVIPVANQTTASGQVTLLDAMMLERPVIVTSCPASVDYVTHEKDALLVRSGDHDDLKLAIQRLWEDGPLRQKLGVAARETGLETFSEEVIGRTLGRVLREEGGLLR
jgi:glycosyltransferase involved in cell wall biosynthesis